jgi:hypothetical protein
MSQNVLSWSVIQARLVAQGLQLLLYSQFNWTKNQSLNLLHLSLKTKGQSMPQTSSVTNNGTYWRNSKPKCTNTWLRNPKNTSKINFVSKKAKSRLIIQKFSNYGNKRSRNKKLRRIPLTVNFFKKMKQKSS